MNVLGYTISWTVPLRRTSGDRSAGAATTHDVFTGETSCAAVVLASGVGAIVAEAVVASTVSEGAVADSAGASTSAVAAGAAALASGAGACDPDSGGVVAADDVARGSGMPMALQTS